MLIRKNQISNLSKYHICTTSYNIFIYLDPQFKSAICYIHNFYLWYIQGEPNDTISNFILVPIENRKNKHILICINKNIGKDGMDMVFCQH